MLRRLALLPLVAALTLGACAGTESSPSPQGGAVPVGGGTTPGSPATQATMPAAPAWKPATGDAPGTTTNATPPASVPAGAPVTADPLPGEQGGVPVTDQEAVTAWETLLNDALSNDPAREGAATLNADERMALIDDSDDTVEALNAIAARSDLPRVRFVASGARTLTGDQCPVDGADECVAVDAQLFGSGGDVIADQANAVVVKRDGTWFVGRPTVCWLLLLAGTACSR